MKHDAKAGGQYAEAMPDGRWAFTTGPYDDIQTSWGPVKPPAAGLITMRLDPVPGSHGLCGHEQDGPYVVLKPTTAEPWDRVAVTHSGGDSSAFGPTGRLYWVPDWNSVQGQGLAAPLIEGKDVAAGGLRHVIAGQGGRDVPLIGSYTYADVGRRIFGYTDIGDVCVGQGNNENAVGGGVLILHGGKRYVLDVGFCWYVRFNRVGDELAIAYWKLHDKRAVIVWLTVAELGVLPLESELAPPPDALPSLDDVPRVGGPFGFICYTFNDAPCLGNINLPIRPPQGTAYAEPIVLPSDRPDLAFARNPEGAQNAIWAVYAGEGPHADPPVERSIVEARGLGDTVVERGVLAYQDSFPLRDTAIALLTRHDVATCVFKRGPNETLIEFIFRSREEYDRVFDRRDAAPVYPTLNLAQETPKRAVETFIAFCRLAIDEFWPGICLFALGRSDVPAELIPYVVRFAAGIIGIPRALFIDQEEPMPMPPLENLLPALQRERARHGDENSKISRHACVDILNRVAWQHRADWGLLKKETGNHGARKEDGAKCSVDHLVRRTDRRGVDCLSDAGSVDGDGKATPTWGEPAEQFPLDRFVEPVQPAGAVEPPVDPPIDPPGGPIFPPPLDPFPILQRLESLWNEFQQLRNDVGELRRELREDVGGLTVQIANDLRALDERIADVGRKVSGGTAPDYEGRATVFGQRVTFTLTPKPKP